MKREKKKVEPVVAPAAPRSIESKTTALVLGEHYNVITSLFDFVGTLTEISENELVFKPFGFDKSKHLRFYTGVNEPFDSEIAVGRSQVVMMKYWDA